MKTPLLMTLAGAACSLLISCQSSHVVGCGSVGRAADIYVTTKSGAPISGAQIVPDYVTTGCTEPVYTDMCGRASLPWKTADGAVYNVEKQGYRTVRGATHAGGPPTHIEMCVGWPN